MRDSEGQDLYLDQISIENFISKLKQITILSDKGTEFFNATLEIG